MKVDKETFFKLQARIPDISFHQSLEWHDTAFKTVSDSLVYYVNTLDDPRICCFGYLAKRRFIGNVLDIQGVSRKEDVNSTELRTFFKSIVEEGYDVITISDVKEYSAEFEVGIRRSGFIHPLGLSLCPMSMVVDLTKPFTFHRKWRSHVRDSEKAGNVFYPVENPTLEDATEFVRMFQELKERKSLGYNCNAEDVFQLVSGNYKLFFMKNSEGKNVAGRLEYTCGKLVYDIYAANTYESLKSGAIYHLQEAILNYLREHKYTEFDYGRIPPCDGKMDDIYIAKSYSGGRPVGYNGQWEYSKSRINRYVLSAYSFLLHKSNMF